MQREPGSAADIYDQYNLLCRTPTSYAWLQYDYANESLSLCTTTFNVSLCICLDNYRIHITKRATAVCTVVTTQLTTDFHIHGSVR